jgi:hypothetical protein
MAVANKNAFPPYPGHLKVCKQPNAGHISCYYVVVVDFGTFPAAYLTRNIRHFFLKGLLYQQGVVAVLPSIGCELC